MEVANEYGYSSREIQEFVKEMYEEKNISIYNSTNYQFEPISKRRENSKRINSSNLSHERNTTKNKNRGNNQKTKELDKEAYYEGKTEGNSGVSNREYGLQQRPNNYDNKSVGNRVPSTTTINVDKNTKTNDLVFNEKKSVANSRKELDNSPLN